MFLIISGAVFSQNWQTVQLQAVKYYICTPSYDYFSAGNIRTIKIDSASVIGNDSLLFNFFSIRDTSTGGTFPNCFDVKGPSWIGSHVLIQSNGYNVFFNKNRDSIFINTLAQLNDSWKMYRFPNSNQYIEATITDLSEESVSGYLDSLKYISLQCKDSAGNIIPDIFNGKKIILSKNNGFAKLCDFYEFPSDTNGYVATISELLTVGEVYDFNIGDQFAYRGYCSSMYSNERYLKTLIGKWYSQGNDTVYYQFKKDSKSFFINYNPFPHVDSIISGDTIIEQYTNLNSYVFNTMPLQTINLMDFGQQHVIDIYEMHRDSFYNNRLWYSASFGDYMFDTCLTTTFESNGGIDRIIKGCGWFNMRRVDNTALPPYDCYVQLYYFKKNNEQWGVLTTTSNLNDPFNTMVPFSFFPNPAKHYITLKYEINQPAMLTLQIFNILGQIIKSDIIVVDMGSHESEIGITTMSEGIYFIKFGNAVKKLIIAKD